MKPGGNKVYREMAGYGDEEKVWKDFQDFEDGVGEFVYCLDDELVAGFLESMTAETSGWANGVFDEGFDGLSRVVHSKVVRESRAEGNVSVGASDVVRLYNPGVEDVLPVILGKVPNFAECVFSEEGYVIRVRIADLAEKDDKFVVRSLLREKLSSKSLDFISELRKVCGSYRVYVLVDYDRKRRVCADDGVLPAFLADDNSDFGLRVYH